MAARAFAKLYRYRSSAIPGAEAGSDQPGRLERWAPAFAGEREKADDGAALSRSRQRDLTVGPIGATLLAFALPTLASNVLQSLNGSINSEGADEDHQVGQAA